MTNTDILLEDLEDVLDDATSIPLSKKYAVDVDKIKTIIEDIRLNTPQETKQAKAIVDSRNNILEEAKKLPILLLKHRRKQGNLLPVTKSLKLLRQKLPILLPRLKNRAMLILQTLKTRLQIFSVTLQTRQTKWLQQHRINQEKCLQQLIIMLMIHFLLLMIHFIRHSVMFAEFAKVLKIHKTKISNFESYWAAYGRLKL